MERGFLGCQRTEGLCAWPPCSLPALSSSVSVHMPSLLPADAWLAQPPSTSQLLPGLPAVNPPQPPHTATAAAPQLSFPHSWLQLFPSPVLWHDPSWAPQISQRLVSPHGNPPPPPQGGLGRQSLALSEKGEQLCKSHRAAEWLHEEQLAMAVSSQIPKRTLGIVSPKSLISCCFTHTYAFSMINHLSVLLLLLHVTSLAPFSFWASPLCPRTISWPVPCRVPLKTTCPSDLALSELCLFLLAAKAGLISKGAHVVCTLELYQQLPHHHPRPYSFLWGGCCCHRASGTWEGRDGLVLGCWAELGQTLSVHWLGHKLHVILGKALHPSRPHWQQGRQRTVLDKSYR